MKVVFFGTPHFVLPVLNALMDHYEVVGVVTTPDVVLGRKKILTPTPVKARFLSAKPIGLILTPEQFNNLSTEASAKEDETMQQLKSVQPDLFVVAAYGKIIPKEFLDIPRFGAINIHPSLLPALRGPSPIQQTILDGLRESGVTIIQMDEEIDHGPVLAVEKVAVPIDATFESLHDIMFEKAAVLLLKTIQQFKNKTLTPTPQDHSKATFCPHIERQNGYFDLQNPPDPVTLDRMIRAYYPWPTAHTKIEMKNKKVKGIKFLPKKRIQMEGGKPMSVKDFLNGYPEMTTLLQKLQLL